MALLQSRLTRFPGQCRLRRPARACSSCGGCETSAVSIRPPRSARRLRTMCCARAASFNSAPGGRAAMPSPIRVEVYSRPGCHLCDDAKAVIHRFRGRYAMELSVIDIDRDPELVAAYGEEIPVVF